MKEYLKDILETESEGDSLGKKADKHDIGEEGGKIMYNHYSYAKHFWKYECYSMYMLT